MHLTGWTVWQNFMQTHPMICSHGPMRLHGTRVPCFGFKNEEG